MKKRTEIPFGVRWKIIGFIEAGNNFSDCATFYSIDASTVRRIYWKYKETGDIIHKKRSGRPSEMDVDVKKMATQELKETKESTRRICFLYDVSHQTIANLVFKYPKTNVAPYSIPI